MRKAFQSNVFLILLGLYPVLALLSNNIGQVDFQTANRAIIIVFLFTLTILVVFKFVYQDWKKAGLAAALLVVLFFSYGHVYNLFENVRLGGVLVGRHRLLILIWIFLAGIGFLRIWKISAVNTNIFIYLNIIVLFLVAFPLIHLTSFALSNTKQDLALSVYEGEPANNNETGPGIHIQADQHLPDVYYIILDGYGRSDTLLADFGFDNSEFLDNLRKRGFFVAECSQSNYSKTDLSLASSLNLNYVENLGGEFTPENTDRTPLWRRIKHNTVLGVFEDLGYTTIAFETGYDFTQLTDADVYYRNPRTGINDFEDMLLRTSAVLVLDELNVLDQYRTSRHEAKRNEILYQLKRLEQVPEQPGPKFIFAHILIPHQPFVFGPDGEFSPITERMHKDSTYYTKDDYIRGYRNQAIFISKRIIETIDIILRSSSHPPIIILQGDHGPSHISSNERMTILNSYYLPDVNAELYHSITPVNSFRVVFNEYFGAELPLLMDVSYYSEYPYAYQFLEVENKCVTGK